MRYHPTSASLGLTVAAAVLAVVSSQEEYDAVIVGAGWAGLRAVDTLLKRGATKVLVLEANRRVGGRSWSKNSDGTENNPNLGEDVVPFDLGVGHNYDSDINEMQNELWEEDILPGSLWEDQEYYAVWPTWPGRASYYRQNEEGGKATKLTNGEGLMAQLWAPFLKFRDDNLDDIFGQSYGETIEQYIEDRDLTDNDSLQFLNMVENAKHLEYGTGEYDMDITEIEFTDPTFHVETNYMGVPGLGWGNVAAKYGEKFRSYIKKNAKVTEINSEDDDEYAIVTYVKNGQERRVKARTVLVTVSIGVLKAGNIKFVPSLPQDKRKSIDATGFGVINKCIMSWNDEEAKIWPDEAEEDMWMLMSTPNDETSGKWTTFSNPSRFKGLPSITAWIGGKDAIEAEAMSDNEIFRNVMKNLNSMFPGMSTPSNAIITRWGQEENILGAYSFPSPGQDFYDDMEVIGRREGKVFFAGEGTSYNGWATTFGAWDSGEKAAKEMAREIEFYLKVEDSINTDESDAIASADEPADESADEPDPSEDATESPPDNADDVSALSAGEALRQLPWINVLCAVVVWTCLG